MKLLESIENGQKKQKQQQTIKVWWSLYTVVSKRPAAFVECSQKVGFS